MHNLLIVTNNCDQVQQYFVNIIQLDLCDSQKEAQFQGKELLFA